MRATLSFHDVSVSRGPMTILSHVDLHVSAGRHVGVVGPNGVGKSTLLATAARAVEPDAGSVSYTPPTATIGWLAQEPDRSDETGRDRLRRRTGVADAQRELDAATEALADGATDAADRYDAALQRWLGLGAADFDARLGSVAAELGLPERLLESPTATLSGGEAARLGLAALLLSRFDAYLLDEPTNDLDVDGLFRLEEWAIALDAPTLLVSHDRRFLERVVTDVIEIDEFEHTVSWFSGGWQAFLDERERARREAWERWEEYDAKRKALKQRSQQQREWAQQGQSKVRRSGENDKNILAFRMNQTEQLAGKAAQTERAMERLEEVEQPREGWELRFDIPAAGRSGDIVARMSGATVDHGDFRLGPVDLLIEHQDRLAIVGHNGAGKSTLIDLIVGRIDADAGSAALGSSVVVGEIEQIRQQFDGTHPLLDSMCDATGWPPGEVRTLTAKFGLVGDHLTRPAASLSPGERTRAAMALLMANGANLLVLDEPTNHLDLPAIEQLEQALDRFGGTVIVVSHDRAFLDALRVTRTVELRDGTLVDNR